MLATGNAIATGKRGLKVSKRAHIVKSGGILNKSEKATTHLMRRLSDTKSLNWLVRATAIIVIALLIVFFITVLRQSETITTEVSTIKDGPYPSSVANGHVETDLVRLETLIDHMAGAVILESEAERNSYEKTINETVGKIGEQIDLINPSYIRDQEELDILKNGIIELKEKTPGFIYLCKQADNANRRTFIEITEYIETNIDPVLSQMMSVNENMLNEAADDVENMYVTVNNSVQTLIIVSLILMLAVLMATIAFTLLIRRRFIIEENARVKLADTLQETRDVNEAKSAFLSNMSHDMRTPMNAIVGLTAIANDHIDDKLRVKQCLTRISTSSQHLLSLINDVLDMNKIESGKVTLSEEEFSLSDLVSEIVVIMQSQPAIQRLNSEITVENITHEVLIGDTMRLRQILLNLTSNAIKYTNEGDTVRLAVVEKDQKRKGYAQIMFRVEDTGIGMKADFVKHIFEPFERERNDFTNFTEGTGLGMAITKNLVDLMGGTIKVESELGLGTSVTIILPFKIAKGAAERTEGIDEARKLFSGKTALVVDKVQLVAENTRNLLEGLGIATKSARSADCAIQEVNEQNEKGKNFDIIILDYDASEGRGLELAKELQEISPDSKFVLSAYDVDGVKDEAGKVGIRTFITKPLFRSRVLDVLKRALAPNEGKKDGEDEGKSDDDVIKPKKQKKKAHVTGRVLIVEDNEINMEIAKTLITDRGAEVEEAFNGLEAVTLVSEKPDGYFDLVFMDWQMPHMNGIEATKSIRKFQDKRGRAHMPIVAMTANTFDSDKEEALAAGMDDFMGKPIDIAELDVTLEKYLPSVDD